MSKEEDINEESVCGLFPQNAMNPSPLEVGVILRHAKIIGGAFDEE
jgi:hypothetical protein